MKTSRSAFGAASAFLLGLSASSFSQEETPPTPAPEMEACLNEKLQEIPETKERFITITPPQLDVVLSENYGDYEMLSVENKDRHSVRIKAFDEASNYWQCEMSDIRPYVRPYNVKPENGPLFFHFSINHCEKLEPDL